MPLRKSRLFFLSALLLGSTLFAASDWETAVELRKSEDFDKAEQQVKKYASPANFEQLKPAEKIEFLRGLLELAHLRALKDDVAGSLALLNWAEGRSDPYQRSVSCVKYAEILLDLGEFDRAKGYLRNADELIKDRASDKETGVAIGQGGEKVDTGGAWRELRDESDALKADIESEEMKAKFGATYGSYVKLRRLQQIAKRARLPRYRNEAIRVADEIIEADPASQFAAAAGYLKGELLAGRVTEDTPKKEIKEVKNYLDKFVKDQPDGLYRGEALMLLGKISLEIEWNAKDAEKYYTQALDYFRKAREKRDAVSLYAAINDDLKSQTAPTQKPTSLNQWKRIVYHDEDPLKLYNIGNAPVWYIDDKEKECVFVVGFIAFANEKYDVAREEWGKILSLSPDIAALDQRLPNVQSRLLQACGLKSMAFWPEDKEKIRNKNIRLQIQYAEYFILLEKFPEAIERFAELFKNEDILVKAVAQLGRATAVDLEFKQDCKAVSEKYCEWVLNQKVLQKEPIYARALLYYGQLKTSRNNLEKLAIPYFERYVREFPKGHDIRIALYSLAKCYLKTDQLAKAERIYMVLKEKDDIYSENLLKRINRFKQNGGAK